MLRGIRGAITVKNNTAKEILDATQILLKQIVKANDIETEDIVSIIFSATPDVNAEFPAKAAKVIGWEDVPRLCAQEIDVPSGLKKCIRVLMHVNMEKEQEKIKHIYLRKAKNLKKG